MIEEFNNRKQEPQWYFFDNSLYIDFNEMKVDWKLFEDDRVMTICIENGKTIDWPLSRECDTIYDKMKYAKGLFDDDQLIKIEKMETYNEDYIKACKQLEEVSNKKVDCHVYFSSPISVSFDLHTDPYDVLLYCVDGHKNFQVEDQIYDLRPGVWLFVEGNKLHKAINDNDFCTMLSFGFRDE